MKWTKDKLQQHLIMTALENKELQNTLQHRDSVLSIMYDLVRSEVPDWYKIEMIKDVIDCEVRRLEQTIVQTNWVDKLLQDSYLQFTEDLEKERRKENQNLDF